MTTLLITKYGGCWCNETQKDINNSAIDAISRYDIKYFIQEVCMQFLSFCKVKENIIVLVSQLVSYFFFVFYLIFVNRTYNTYKLKKKKIYKKNQRQEYRGVFELQEGIRVVGNIFMVTMLMNFQKDSAYVFQGLLNS